MTQLPFDEVTGTPSSRGIADLESGLAIARSTFLVFRHSLLGLMRGDFSEVSMGLLALVTRAQGVHDGALRGIEEDNSHGTFPLIPCYAENAAVLLWIFDHPNDLSRLASDARTEERFAIGRLVSNADKRAKGFKGIYEQLSEFSHPVATGFHQPWRVVSDEVPSFKTADDQIWACFRLTALTEVHANVWPAAYRASVRRSSDA
jgi:hypothetical protein